MERRSPIRPKLSAFHQQQNPDRNIQSTGKLHFVPDSLSVHGQTTYVLLILFPLNPIISVNWHKCTDGHVQQKVQLMTALFLKHLSTTWASASCDSLTEWWNWDWEIWNFTSWEWCVITTVHKISQKSTTPAAPDHLPYHSAIRQWSEWLTDAFIIQHDSSLFHSWHKQHDRHMKGWISTWMRCSVYITSHHPHFTRSPAGTQEAWYSSHTANTIIILDVEDPEKTLKMWKNSTKETERSAIHSGEPYKLVLMRIRALW